VRLVGPIQNFIKLTFGCNIFNVVSLVSSRDWFNSDVGKFNYSTFAINKLETEEKLSIFK